MNLILNQAWMPVVLVLSTGVVSGSVSIALNSRDAEEIATQAEALP